MSQIKEEIISELEDLSPRTYAEVLDFIRFLKFRRQKPFRTPPLQANPCSGEIRSGRGGWAWSDCKGDIVVFHLRPLDGETAARLVIATPGRAMLLSDHDKTGPVGAI